MTTTDHHDPPEGAGDPPARPARRRLSLPLDGAGRRARRRRDGPARRDHRQSGRAVDRADLGGSASTLQWALVAYTLSIAIGLIISARLGDLVGRRRMFLIGMVGFTAASLAVGSCRRPGVLILARVCQGRPAPR